MKKTFLALLFLVTLVAAISLAITGCGDSTTTATSGNADLQKQIDDIKATVPKFAIPMREVGDRFEDMNAAAQGGNWALAAYMSKYMNNAMKPAKLTKPEEYKTWSTFYTGTFDPVNKAVTAKDISAFDKAYADSISSCNSCHEAMGYKFIKILKQNTPADQHVDYTLKSEPGDVPK